VRRLPRLEHVRHELRAVVFRAVEAYDAKGRAKAAELLHPVGQGGLGDKDNVRPGDAFGLVHPRDDGDRLEGLAEAHLVGEDAVHA